MYASVPDFFKESVEALNQMTVTLHNQSQGVGQIFLAPLSFLPYSLAPSVCVMIFFYKSAVLQTKCNSPYPDWQFLNHSLEKSHTSSPVYLTTKKKGSKM